MRFGSFLKIIKKGKVNNLMVCDVWKVKYFLDVRYWCEVFFLVFGYVL